MTICRWVGYSKDLRIIVNIYISPRNYITVQTIVNSFFFIFTLQISQNNPRKTFDRDRKY